MNVLSSYLSDGCQVDWCKESIQQHHAKACADDLNDPSHLACVHCIQTTMTPVYIKFVLSGFLTVFFLSRPLLTTLFRWLTSFELTVHSTRNVVYYRTGQNSGCNSVKW